MIKISYLALGLFLLVSTTALAQRQGHFYVNANLGGMYYIGELKDDGTPDTDYLHPSLGASLRYNYGNIVEFGLGYLRGSLSGADSLRPSNPPSRNFHFKSRIQEISFTTKVILFNHNKKRERRNQVIWHPGIVLGLGYFHFDPKLQHANGWLSAQPLGTEGQNVESGDYPDPYKLWAISYKVGAEFTFNLTDRSKLAIYSIYNFTNTDYIDDVGGVYPDAADVATTPNGAQTLQYTYMDKDDVIRAPGDLRGNPDTKDGFYTFGVGFSFKLSDESRKKGRGRKVFRLKKRSRF